MEPKSPLQELLREVWPLLMLTAILLVIVVLLQAIGDRIISQSLTEALIRALRSRTTPQMLSSTSTATIASATNTPRMMKGISERCRSTVWLEAGIIID